MRSDLALTPDAALGRLKEGKRRFLAGGPSAGTGNPKRRLAVAQRQAPFAVLVSCSDSRVPPEILFLRGLGKLFIVRNAGNTVGTVALGSIEFAVAQLHVPLVVVMGHQRCGAAEAALSVVRDDAALPGSLGRMTEPIVPAVLTAQRQEGDARTSGAW